MRYEFRVKPVDEGALVYWQPERRIYELLGVPLWWPLGKKIYANKEDAIKVIHDYKESRKKLDEPIEYIE